MTPEEIAAEMRDEMARSPIGGTEYVFVTAYVRSVMRTGITDTELRERIGNVLAALDLVQNERDQAKQARRTKPTPVHPADDPTLSPAQRDAGRMIRKTDAALDAMDAEGGEGR